MGEGVLSETNDPVNSVQHLLRGKLFGDRIEKEMKGFE